MLFQKKELGKQHSKGSCLSLCSNFKKAPFWKYATIATVCIEQEYVIYETLAKGCAYDMSKFLGKVIKRYWQSIPTGYSIDHNYWKLPLQAEIDKWLND